MAQIQEAAQGTEQRLVLGADDPGRVTAEKIVEAVQQIVRLANPLRVVAFGSRARGDHRDDSDLDLAVIVDKYNPKTDKRPIWRADIDVWMDMDILVYDIDKQNFMQGSLVSLQSEVKREGVSLFDRETNLIDRIAAARLAR